MVHKASLVLLFFYLCCCFLKVSSEDVTVYVTVTANSTTPEEATPTEEEVIQTPTVEIEKTEEYKRFEEALGQTENDCMNYAYLVSLNLFHANVVGIDNCKNGYSDTLKKIRQEENEEGFNPCEGYNKQFMYGVKYLDANVRLLCTQYSTNTTNQFFDETMQTDDEEKGKLCPIINLLKTNNTRFQEELFNGCKDINFNMTKNDPASNCITDILTRFKEMQSLQSKLNPENRESISYRDEKSNEAITIKMNITDKFFDLLNENCPQYSKITNISSGLSLTISFTTILIFSLFIMFINNL